MKTAEQAIIYLADQRSCTQADAFRSYQTLGNKTGEKNALPDFGSLSAINDDTLRAGSSRQWTGDKPSLITLLPLVGKLTCEFRNKKYTVDAGQMITFFIAVGEKFIITNAYEKELINYLQLWSVVDNAGNSESRAEVELHYENILVPVLVTPLFSILLGKCSGRTDLTHNIGHYELGAFVYVLEGDFEVQGRLLSSRDGLALRNLNRIDFEALSAQGIILIYEQHR